MVSLAELGEVAKAYEDAPRTRPTEDYGNYRKSKASWMNPTQETWVKQGTETQRYSSRVGDVVTGGRAGKQRNIAAGDTVQFNRFTGKRAPKWGKTASSFMGKVK